MDADLVYEAVESGLVDLRSLEAAVRAFLRDPVEGIGASRLTAQLELLAYDAPREGPVRDRIHNLLASGVVEDPVPASPSNERLLDHLARVSVAVKRYGWDGGPSGLDDRGVTWVRYGPPGRIRTVSFDEGQILQAARSRGLGVSRADFPDNEVWMYDELSSQGVYLFVKQRGGEYRIGETNDLIPRSLRTRGVNRSPRAAGFSIVGLQTLRYVLGQLALFHPSYSNRYGQVQNYVSYVEESEVSARANSRGIAGTPAIEGFDRGPWRGFARAVERNVVDDEGIAAARRQTMPKEFSDVSLDSARVGLVRFLTPEGTTTRTVLWSAEGEGVRSSLWQTGSGHQLLASEVGSGRFRTDLVTDLDARLAVQIDRAVPIGDSTLWKPVASGYAPLKPDLDPMAALEMSDPLPFVTDDVVLEGEALRANISRGSVTPLFGRTLEGVEGFGVYLEAYVPGATGVVRIAYTIERQRDGRLFQRGSTESDEYEFIRPVRASTVPIAFLVDRANWEGADVLRLVVRVENLGSGTVVSRELSVRVE